MPGFDAVAVEHRQVNELPLSRELRVHLQGGPALVGIFPNHDAMVRLIGALLLEQNDE